MMALFRKGKKKRQPKTPYELYKKTMTKEHPRAVVATPKEFAVIQKRLKRRYGYGWGEEPPERRRRLRRKPETFWQAAKKYKTIREERQVEKWRRQGVSEKEIRRLMGK